MHSTKIIKLNQKATWCTNLEKPLTVSYPNTVDKIPGFLLSLDIIKTRPSRWSIKIL